MENRNEHETPQTPGAHTINSQREPTWPIQIANQIARILMLSIILLGSSASPILARQGVDPAEKERMGKAVVAELQRPVAKPERPAPTDPQEIARTASRARRYNNSGQSRLEDLPPGSYTEVVYSNDEPLPVSQSSLVARGRVTGYQPYFSEDRSTIFTEIQFEISEVIYARDSQIKAGTTVAAERSGGSIKLPDGRTVSHITIGQGIPRVAEECVLFLQAGRDDASFLILTGYVIRGNRVFPIDRFDGNRGRGVYPFADSTFSDLQASLHEVRP